MPAFEARLFPENETDDLRPRACIVDPAPNVETALHLAWFYMGQWGAARCLLVYSETEQTMFGPGVTDDDRWKLKPSYQLIAPSYDLPNGKLEKLMESA